MPKKNLPSKNSLDVLAIRINKKLQSFQKNLKQQLQNLNWDFGQWIHEDLLQNKDRADYGEHFYEKLSLKVPFSPTSLKRIHRFYRTYPIRPHVTELTWSHFLHLITVEDPELRKSLEKLTIANNWDSVKLKKVIDAKVVKKTSSVQIEIPKLALSRGQLNTARVILAEEKGQSNLYFDYGFRVKRLVPKEQKQIKNKDLFRIDPASGQGLKDKADFRESEMFTFKANVVRIVDADTLVTIVHCGPPNTIEDRLRFKGIDCPEIDTPEGKKAKRFIEERLNKVDFLVIKTYKNDKYARFLVDVFYLPGESDPEKVAAQGIFLNQELLDHGLAKIWKS